MESLEYYIRRRCLQLFFVGLIVPQLVGGFIFWGIIRAYCGVLKFIFGDPEKDRPGPL